jgi:hypothetical protein
LPLIIFGWSLGLAVATMIVSRIVTARLGAPPGLNQWMWNRFSFLVLVLGAGGAALLIAVFFLTIRH